MGVRLKILWKDFELLDQTLQEIRPLPRQVITFFLLFKPVFCVVLFFGLFVCFWSCYLEHTEF